MIDMQYYPNPKKMKGHEDFNFAHVYTILHVKQIFCNSTIFQLKKRPSSLTSIFFKIVIQLQNESFFLICVIIKVPLIACLAFVLMFTGFDFCLVTIWFSSLLLGV